MALVLTHRGLEPSKKEFYPESSYEAFSDQLSRGFGIEFDPAFCKDGIIVMHDKNLSKITNNQDNRNFSEISIEELKQLKYGKEKTGRIASFNEVLKLISNSSCELHALHLKGINQTNNKVDILLNEIKKYPEVINKLLIFDVKPETAIYIKSKIPQIKLAPSVAHEYDLERYNNAVNGTLISAEDAINYKEKNLYEWVWLDEWDTKDKNNGEKKFYIKELFNMLRDVGCKIALITPELHGTSPGLLGGESHKDAQTKESLFSRIKEILSLNPDAVCTDWPEDVREIINKME